MTALAAFCYSHRRWLLELIETLVRLESPTDDKRLVDTCGAMLALRLTELGARVTRVASATTGDHLRAEFGTGSRQVLLLGHFDTVWPAGQIERMPCELRDGQLYGPGTLDMKAGLALATLATRALFTLAPPAEVRGHAVDHR